MSFGSLYIVATPIGNLEDISMRALRVLREVDVIAAEDTRHSLKLLSHYGISKPLMSYWSEKEKVRTGEIVEKLRSGLSVALISDAGTPGISDPGAVLIKRALEEGITVIPVPGPSALIAALSISGLSTEEFTFLGFLPPKTTQRRKKLAELKHESRTLVFYEAPHRILDTLGDLGEEMGERKIAVVRELTKLHEEAVRGTASEILAMVESRTIAGEYVVVVEGMRKEHLTLDEALDEVLLLMKKGLGRKEAVKTVAEGYGLSKKELYDRSLEKK
ncbi:MAG TPA: 16S rRNA (cytidine(1402)-2'-O)-methyltransferase [Dissulfurispiraceae bacterium]